MTEDRRHQDDLAAAIERVKQIPPADLLRVAAAVASEDPDIRIQAVADWLTAAAVTPNPHAIKVADAILVTQAVRQASNP